MDRQPVLRLHFSQHAPEAVELVVAYEALAFALPVLDREAAGIGAFWRQVSGLGHGKDARQGGDRHVRHRRRAAQPEVQIAGVRLAGC